METGVVSVGNTKAVKGRALVSSQWVGSGDETSRAWARPSSRRLKGCGLPVVHHIWQRRSKGK